MDPYTWEELKDIVLMPTADKPALRASAEIRLRRFLHVEHPHIAGVLALTVARRMIKEDPSQIGSYLRLHSPACAVYDTCRHCEATFDLMQRARSKPCVSELRLAEVIELYREAYDAQASQEKGE